MEKIDLSWSDVIKRCQKICSRIIKHNGFTRQKTLFGIPRGGVFPAIIIAGMMERLDYLTETPSEAAFFIDDIIDNGVTQERWTQQFNIPFFALVDKNGVDSSWAAGKWITFPWERMDGERSPTDAVVRLLQYIGEDPSREGLRETPKRVLQSYDTLFAGYHQDPKDVIKVFQDGACDEMVLLKDIEFVSCCEHHMLPFIGKAHIAYIPDGRVIGVSKLARILDIYARRLQIQERISQQVTQCLMDHLKPKGAACILEAKHLCMTCRGVQKQDSIMTTSSLQGVFLTKPETRAELLAMIKT